MRVAIISDSAGVDEGFPALRHFFAGLTAEGVNIIHVASRGLEEPAPPCESRLEWNDSKWGGLRSLHLSQLKDRLEELNVAIIHALGGRLWSASLKLGRQLGVPVVLGLSTPHDLRALHRLRRRIRADRPALLAAAEPLAQAALQTLEHDATVQVVPPGVPGITGVPGVQGIPGAPVTDEPDPHHLNVEGAVCAGICGTGFFDSDCQALFEALSQVIADFPQAQFFLDGRGRDPHPLWLAARRYGLLSNLSMAPRRLGQRELLLMADLLIQPQPTGQSLGLPLQAMARGVPVLACHDQWVDYLIDDQTAWLVERADAGKWEEMIRRAIADPAQTRQLGLRARQWVRANRPMGDQVVRTAALYRQTAGQAIRFPGAGPAPA